MAILSCSFQRFPGGYVNISWLCSVPSAPEDKLIVRINPVVQLPKVNRDLEYMVIKAAASRGIAQPLYARYIYIQSWFNF